jgi:hypothetical protein
MSGADMRWYWGVRVPQSPGDLEGPMPGVPSFTAVARLPSTTAPALHDFLTTPHGDMPDMKLKAGEFDAVIAYIFSLKQP